MAGCNINHHPLFNVEYITEHYTKKDGVPVKYVCTSELSNENYAGDIYYRDTPHPEFGNYYFRLFENFAGDLHIQNADKIEDLTFSMIEGPDGYEYSQYRHDFRVIGKNAIDGGRHYTRVAGKDIPKIKQFAIKNGIFKEL